MTNRRDEALAAEIFGGKPPKGTPADRRLTQNRDLPRHDDQGQSDKRPHDVARERELRRAAEPRRG
jgi:hypothetical protein